LKAGSMTSKHITSRCCHDRALSCWILSLLGPDVVEHNITNIFNCLDDPDCGVRYHACKAISASRAAKLPPIWGQLVKISVDDVQCVRDAATSAIKRLKPSISHFPFKLRSVGMKGTFHAWKGAACISIRVRQCMRQSFEAWHSKRPSVIMQKHICHTRAKQIFRAFENQCFVDRVARLASNEVAPNFVLRKACDIRRLTMRDFHLDSYYDSHSDTYSYCSMDDYFVGDSESDDSDSEPSDYWDDLVDFWDHTCETSARVRHNASYHCFHHLRSHDGTHKTDKATIHEHKRIAMSGGMIL